MPLSAWQKWWRRPSPHSKKLNAKRYHRKCFLEILEDRTLLSNTYTVNLATDTALNTGQQTGPTSGDLRWCIEQADLTPGSVIQFDPTVFPSDANTTIALSQGELQISASMDIQGPGASTITVSGTDGKGGGSRVFDITNNSSVVVISGLTIASGNANVAYTPIVGNQGGDIFNGGNLTLQNDVVTSGLSIGTVGGPTGRGGAIFNAEGQGTTVLTLDNTIVEASTAKGLTGITWNTTGYLTARSGGEGGPGQGGGIYNDVTALLIVTDGSQIINNTALGGDGGGGGKGATIGATGAPGGNGGNGGDAGFAEGGGIYNAGSLQLNGTSLSSIVLADNAAQGGKGGLGGNGGVGQDGALGGIGGRSGNGGSGGFADGGGVYNTGTVKFPASFTMQYVNFLGNQAIGGVGNNAGVAGNAGNGSKGMGGTGGEPGSGGSGGNAQGGGIFSGFGALSVQNVLFGLDANGVSDQAVGAAGGNGGSAGNGGNSSGESVSKKGNPGAPGGAGGVGGDAGFAKGGAVANLAGGGNVSFTNTIFDSTVAQGGAGGKGNNGGIGGKGVQANEGNSKTPYSAGIGGLGGSGGAGGAGGSAVGGGVFNAVGSLTVGNSSFLSDRAIAGSGGAAGAGNTGGTGGARTSKSFLAETTRVGGLGGSGGKGGNGGNAQGGGFYNLVGTVTILNTSFKARTAGGIGNEAIGGAGGAAGNAGNGGQGGDNGSSMGNVVAGAGGNGGVGGVAGLGGLAEGGAGGNQGGNTFFSSDLFTSSLVKTGIGGAGGNGGTGGDGGNSSATANADGVGGHGGDASAGGASGKGLGGAIVVTAANVSVTNSTFGGANSVLGNQIVGGAGGAGGLGGGIGHWGHGRNAYAWIIGGTLAGNGGQGGQGASVYGGALSASAKVQTIQIAGSTFTNSVITSGAGGAGGQAGLLSLDTTNEGINGTGGNAGLAQGGAVSISSASRQSATLSNVTIASSTATASGGGAGAINNLASITIPLIIGTNGKGSPGGNGGSVQGVGLADINDSLTITGNSSFSGGVGQAGMGGAGGSSSVAEPHSWEGGAGGNGGNVLGGGVFLSNKTTGTLNFKFNGGSASNNKLSAGNGGNGGFAGASTTGSKKSNVAGGAGGSGGAVQGGGIYILAGSKSVNATTLGNLVLDGNVLVGGTGGIGGAGYKSPGGTGGLAQGGGVYNSSLDGSSASSLTLTGSTLAGNLVTGGIGGNAGSGTTPNGGAGGDGGGAGAAEGAGMYNGNNTPVTVVNSTFGGGSVNSSTPNANANILTGTRGGRGGDAGTPAGIAKNDGGLGGAGGNVEGANVYIASNNATFINDTIVYGQATSVGLGGAGGSGAGSGGKNGAAGTNGVGLAGGVFAAAGSTDSVGNTIIDLNSANVVPLVSPDVSGTFTSLGNNILGVGAASNGFTQPTDKLSVTAAKLNLGPLLNNGGPTLTDALLNNTNGKSVAVNAGGNTLVTSTANPWSNLFGPTPTDQRGPGFPRLDLANKLVDIGAYELNQPLITGLNPPSADEQSASFTLTISGSGFVPGATVSFSGTILTPLTVGSSQITVTVPGALLPDEGTANVNVSIPDGSGVSGETLASNTVPFAITEASTLTLINPGDQDNNEGDTVDPVTITSSDPDTTFSATGLPPGLSIDPKTGTIAGTIDLYAVSNGAGPFEKFTVTVNGIDDGVVRGSVTFTWTVDDTTPPSLTSPGTQNSNEGDSVTGLSISAVDADPGTFTDVVNGQHTLPTGLTIDPNTGIISGTIGSRAEGTYTVTISASDGSGNVGSTKFTWNVADTTPPTVTSPGNQTSNEGANIKGLAIQTVDADGFNITGLPTGLTYNATTGVISGTIDPYAVTNGKASQDFTVTVTALDNGYQSKPITFTWTVNDTSPPALTNPGTENNNEGDKVVSLQIQAQDADAGTFTDVANGKHTLPTGLSIDPNTGKISGTIGARAEGTYQVTISASDGTNNVGTTTFTWNVADTTPPTVTNPGNQTNNESDTVKSLAIQAVDADSFTITGLPTGLTYDATTGVISGTIGAYAAGTYTVSVTATDNGHTSQPLTFSWTVNDTTPPTITSPGDQTSNEGQTITGLTIQNTDGETFSASQLPTGLSINATTGVISGTIDSRAANIYNVTVTAFDGSLSASTNFTWTVNDTTPPLLNSPGTQNSNEGDTVSMQIQSQDADSGTFTDVVNGQHTLPTGLSIDANGKISGTIDPRAAGTYNVTISASDGTDNVGTTTFTWNVADTTPPLLTNPGGQSNNEGDTVTGLAIKAVDADSFSATGLPTGLSIDPKTGVISGTIDPQASNGSPYTVTVFAYDNGKAASVSFNWLVADTTPPTFSIISGQVSNEGDTVTLATNPVDADPGTIKAIGLPPGLSIDPNTGVISGTIDAHGAGAYGVSVSASDNGHSGGIAFTWKVNDTTPPTLTNPGGQNNSNGQTISLTIHALDADPGTFTAKGLPPGLSINPNTGVISGTISASPGTYHVTISASDGGFASSIVIPWAVHQASTSVVVTNVFNTYMGLFQAETVTAQVTNPQGIPINSGVIAFQVNGQTVVAPVVNGFASATIVTSLLDMDLTVLLNDFFTHSLDAVFSDTAGIFGSSGSSVSEPGMLFDYLLFLESISFGSLAQQLTQLPSG